MEPTPSPEVPGDGIVIEADLAMDIKFPVHMESKEKVTNSLLHFKIKPGGVLTFISFQRNARLQTNSHYTDVMSCLRFEGCHCSPPKFCRQ